MCSGSERLIGRCLGTSRWRHLIGSWRCKLRIPKGELRAGAVASAVSGISAGGEKGLHESYFPVPPSPSLKKTNLLSV